MVRLWMCTQNLLKTLSFCFLEDKPIKILRATLLVEPFKGNGAQFELLNKRGGALFVRQTDTTGNSSEGLLKPSSRDDDGTIADTRHWTPQHLEAADVPRVGSASGAITELTPPPQLDENADVNAQGPGEFLVRDASAAHRIILKGFRILCLKAGISNTPCILGTFK